MISFGAVQPQMALANYQDEIDQLKQDVGNLDGRADELQIQGNTLQEAVSGLQARINGIQATIIKNEEKQVGLATEIVQAQADITERNEALSGNLRQMYLEGEVSSLEKVASSKSISEFVDKQEYRNKIQDRVSTAKNEIKALKISLEGQEAEVKQLIRDDSAMKAQVDAERGKQARLLADTRGEEVEFQKQIKGKQSQIEDLQEKQAELNRQLAAQSGSYYVGGSSSYPWDGQGFPCAGGDPWGMCFRQCVSYTAWKVAATGKHMPFWGGVGNANQWPGNARAAGIPTGSEPRAGAIAVLMAGQYGHTMYVEEVLGGGMIRISEYNFRWDGRYSERVQSGAGLTYVYF